MASKMGIYGCLAVVALLLHVAAAADTIPVNWPGNGDLTVVAKAYDTVMLTGVASNVQQLVDGVNTWKTISAPPPNAKLEPTPRSITIQPRASGLLHFRCTDPDNCMGGHMLTIKVSNSDGTVTPSRPSPLDGPSGSSSSLTVSGFFITLASYIVAFLY